jgi:midasin (ATPase involved in ribosome maturation)
MRLGYWIILDELNLAPSDVLEALNRVLDDNRELFVPETQTLIKAHPSFRIFATQNPSGSSYGGRKSLSRAFRNRLVEGTFFFIFEEVNRHFFKIFTCFIWHCLEFFWGFFREPIFLLSFVDIFYFKNS